MATGFAGVHSLRAARLRIRNQPGMKIQSRVWLYYLLVLGLVLGALLAEAAISPPVSGLWAAGVLLVGAVVQFVFLRCPHCGSLAILRRRWLSTPLVGECCEHCHREY